MAVSRIRRVETRREFDNCVDDFVTQGYGIREHGEQSAMLRKKSWGKLGWHIVWFLLTAGVGNVIYALYAHYSADEVLIRIDPTVIEGQGNTPQLN